GLSGVPHFSPDGGRVALLSLAATAIPTAELRVTDLTSGAEVHRLTSGVGDPAQADLSRVLFGIRALGPGGAQVACAPLHQPGLGARDRPPGRLAARLRPPPGKPPLPTAAWASFSPDGKKLLAVLQDKAEARAVLWELARPGAPRELGRQPVKENTGPEGPALPGVLSPPSAFPGLRFSSDGTRVGFATADRKAVRVVDVTADPPAPVAEVPAPAQVV